MSKETAVITLGILVIILPFLGFPEAWRVFFFVVTGIGLVVLGFYLRAEVIVRGGKKTGNRPFVENMHRPVNDVRMPTYERQEHQG